MDERWGAQYWMTRRSPSTQLRIGHAERERTAEELKEHTHAGRLELHEFEERVEKAYRAKTQADLAVLTHDLPPLHSVYNAGPKGQRPNGGGGFFHYAAMGALSSYVSLCLLMIFIWAISGFGYFWPIWIIGPWGVMLLPSLLMGRLSRRRRHPARARWY
ncbi:MAG: DUF1707 domain-containing protein [Acidimicrobiaceae bacterium]|nr:DUF1707 domain-containing protein [Acidimicrobiaceae bacterium]MBO0747613.1 DUF1707 domain-containing protein [Acidimicrobiaceae bacterium]